MTKVLILDDDEAIVEGLTMALNDEGIGVVGTTSPFQLPFLLRGESRFLIFSGSAPNELAAIAAEVGAIDFIHKGDDFGAIVRRIKFWADDAHGEGTSSIEPHVAVITPSRLSEAAVVLRAGGYFVTMHPPAVLPPPDAAALAI